MEEVVEYTTNIRVLLRTKPKLAKLIFERQVLTQLIPKIQGRQQNLSGPLYELLHISLDGPEASGDFDPAAVRQAGHDGLSLAIPSQKAEFPRAAAALANVLDALEEFGVYPPPPL